MRRLRTIRMGLHHPVGAQIVDLFLHFVILTCLMSDNSCVFHFTCFTRDLGQRSGPCHAKGMMEEKKHVFVTSRRMGGISEWQFSHLMRMQNLTPRSP